MNDVLT
jgi:transposase InsO family protein